MMGRYRKSQEGNRSRFYFLLSIVFVIVIVKWGFPFFIRIIAGEGVAINKVDKDIIPPQMPILTPLPEATNEAAIIVEGYTEAGAKIELNINDVLSKTDNAKEDGSFRVEASIQNGQNRVQVRAVDGANNASMSEVKLVTLDKEPVAITVTTPKDGTEFIGKNSQMVDITGKTNKQGTQVLANNSFVDVSRDGSFTYKYLLNPGENEIKLVASDKAGNRDEKTIKLIYSP